MRRAARTDENHREIIDGLRQRGYSVLDTSRLGDGFPDIVVGKAGVTSLMEIKREKRRGRIAGKLTAAQQDLMALWRGSTIHVVSTVEEATAAFEIDLRR